jgi:hypothetical protein
MQMSVAKPHIFKHESIHIGNFQTWKYKENFSSEIEYQSTLYPVLKSSNTE